MSDCSTHSFDVNPIRGEIHWKEGMRPAPLRYARYVNGQERVAEWVELDGWRYVPEGEMESLRNAYNGLQGHFDKTRERWMQRGAYIAKQRERIAELESLVRDWHVFANNNGLDQSCADYDEWIELEQRMAALGLMEGDAE